ncbi:hypothetical protein BDR26DRAFT_938088 [Obelidium mucronatum]|nr:hypothetical protein BDR26DRAFT_938088 [Obelidium mucronatum]
MSTDTDQDEWEQILHSTKPKFQTNPTGSPESIIQLPDLSFGNEYVTSTLEGHHLSQQQLQQVIDQMQQTPKIQQPQPQQQLSTYLNTSRQKSIVRRQASNPYTRPLSHCLVSSPLVSKPTMIIPQQHAGGNTTNIYSSRNFSNQYYSNSTSAAGISANISQQSTQFSQATETPPRNTTLSTLTEDKEIHPINREIDKVERGRKVHREAEKQRRESLRLGFEKLKDLLPTSAIGSDKSWSQTRLLETGLDYILELKREADEKMMENIKLRDALRQVIKIHGNSSIGEN